MCLFPPGPTLDTLNQSVLQTKIKKTSDNSSITQDEAENTSL